MPLPQVRAEANPLDLSGLQLPTDAEANAFWRAGAPPGAGQMRGDVMSDAMGLLLKQRIIFLGSQVLPPPCPRALQRVRAALGCPARIGLTPPGFCALVHASPFAFCSKGTDGISHPQGRCLGRGETS